MCADVRSKAVPIINKDNAGGDWCIVVVAEMDHSDVIRWQIQVC